MNPILQQLGVMLTHSLWEDTIVWCGWRVCLWGVRRPEARYVAGCVALASMAILPWATYDVAEIGARRQAEHVRHAVQWVSAPTSAAQHEAAGAARASPMAEHAADRKPTNENPLPPATVPQGSWERWLPGLVMVWGCGVVVFSIRYCGRWLAVRRMMGGPLAPLSAEWRERFERLLRIAGIRRVIRLGESAATLAPVMAGWLKPVILLPVGTLTNLPADQIEAIILHELAHVARHDYLVNLLQGLVETVFFYHPAIWSVSRQIRREREMACDDQAVRWCDEPMTYAEALAGFEEYRARAPMLAMTGEGALGGMLFERIQRVLGGAPPERRRGMGVAGLAGLWCIALYLGSMVTTPALVTAGEEALRAMKRAGATALAVIDERTGKAIAGAEIDMAGRRKEADGEVEVYEPGKEVLGYTDGAGRMETTKLSADYDYRIFVKAAGHPVGMFLIEPGDRDRICALEPGVHVAGKIVDPRGILRGTGVSQPVRLAAVYYVGDREIQQEIKLPNARGEIPFEFADLPAKGVWIGFQDEALEKYGSYPYGAGPAGYKVIGKGDVDDFKIDLGVEQADLNEEIDKQPVRKVEITLKSVDGAGVTGSLRVEQTVENPPRVTGTGNRSRSRGTMLMRNLPADPLTDGKTEVETPVGSSLTLLPGELEGYWFAPVTFQVPAGEGALKREVVAMKAGAIRGKVTIAPGLEHRKLTLTYVALKPPAGVSRGEVESWAEPQTIPANGEYVISPLPLGGTYATVVDSAPGYYVSEVATMDGAHPLARGDINVGGAAGILRGRFLDKNGMPAAYEEVLMQYHPADDLPPYHRFLSSPTTTGSDGTFEIHGMNFDVPGYYTVVASGKVFVKTEEHIDGRTAQPVVMREKAR